jgi:hypothetical protein
VLTAAGQVTADYSTQEAIVSIVALAIFALFVGWLIGKVSE